jgi:hypothetical protein
VALGYRRVHKRGVLFPCQQRKAGLDILFIFTYVLYSGGAHDLWLLDIRCLNIYRVGWDIYIDPGVDLRGITVFVFVNSSSRI